MRPARRSVMQALAVHRAEVAARGHVAPAQVELDAQRLEHAAADLVLERIVAEQTEVARARSRA